VIGRNLVLFLLSLGVLLLLACGSPTNHVQKGDDLIKQGAFQQGIEQYEEAIRRNPEEFAAFHQRGLVYTSLGLYKQALHDFDEAIRLNPKHSCWPSPSCDWPSGPALSLWKGGPERLAASHHSRGLAYSDLGHYDLALPDFDEAIRLDPKLAEAYSGRSVVYSAIGKSIEAALDVAMAEELRTGSP
jgi:tetratricopeptide (TPR) repeat protein